MNSLAGLALRIQQQLDERLNADDNARLLVAITGAPGSGKSTLAEALLKQLDTGADSSSAVILPMDGFHLDNAVLEPRGLLPRKGSPDTFDVDGLESLLGRIRQTRKSVYIPVFDRAADLARVAASSIEPQHRIILIEGNYLLLQQPGWQQLAACFDLSVMLDVPLAELERRLVQRWLDHGLEPAAAARRAADNDIPNGQQVVMHSAAADIVYSST